MKRKRIKIEMKTDEQYYISFEPIIKTENRKWQEILFL